MAEALTQVEPFAELILLVDEAMVGGEAQSPYEVLSPLEKTASNSRPDVRGLR